MKRGFLLSCSKPYKSLASGVAIAPDELRGTFKIPAIPTRENIPEIGTPPAPGLSYMRITQFPFHTAVGEPYSIFLLYPGAKEAIEAIPGLPTPYMPSLRVHYRIGDAPGAGKGMFALTDLDTGDLILRERPLLLFPRYTFGNITSLQMIFMRMITSMKLEDCAEFIKLANCKTEGDPIVGIMHTNALNALRMPGPYDGRYGGVCLDLSRVNHSCSPNATCRWILKDIMYELRALRPIKKGEQIFISYIYLLQSRSDRQEHLQSSYAFACTCPSCSLPPSGISHSDIRRNLLENRGTIGDPNDDSILNTWIKDISLPDDHVIGHSLKFVDIMNAEGFVDEQVCELHYPRLAKAYCALKDAENAKLWAKRTAQIVMAIYGDDYGWNKVADSPESTDWWGRRKRGLSCS